MSRTNKTTDFRGAVFPPDLPAATPLLRYLDLGYTGIGGPLPPGEQLAHWRGLEVSPHVACDLHTVSDRLLVLTGAAAQRQQSARPSQPGAQRAVFRRRHQAAAKSNPGG